MIVSLGDPFPDPKASKVRFETYNRLGLLVTLLISQVPRLFISILNNCMHLLEVVLEYRSPS